MDEESAYEAMAGCAGLSIKDQCRLLEVSRSGYYRWKARRPLVPGKGVKAAELEVFKAILKAFTEGKAWGYRKMSRYLREREENPLPHATERLVRRLCRDNGLKGASPRFKTTRPPKGKYYKYPYLLKGKALRYANQVWSTDITYIKLPSGRVYLTAVIDWYSRRILSWRLGAGMETSFCLDVLHEAVAEFGIPAIFNTDCGSQYLSDDFVDALKSYGIQISNDSVGRCLDNIRCERFWKTVKYEFVFLNEWDSITDLGEGLEGFIRQYNEERPHEALGYRTPDAVYKEGCFPIKEDSNIERETA